MVQQLLDIPVDARSPSRTYIPGEWREKGMVAIANPLDTPPSWLNLEVFNALNKITPPHVRKKRTTILRLAEAEAAGVSMNDVFAMTDTCSGPAWHGYTGRPGGWKDNPEIAEAFVIATRRAHYWYDMEEETRQRRRQRLMSDHNDALVELAGEAIETLAELTIAASSETVRLNAASEVLDRAGETTASKASTEHNVTISTQAPRMKDIRERRRQRQDVIPEEVWQGGTSDAGPTPLPPPPPADVFPALPSGDVDDSVELVDAEVTVEELLNAG